MSSTTGIVLFVVGIIVSIMIHEWGHFASARKFGMRADRFFLGFGPTLWSTWRGETEYGVKALPLGGFVRVLGMSPGDERRPPLRQAWLDREQLATERRQHAEATHGDVLTVAAIPSPAWDRLARMLDERGTPGPVASAIVTDVRAAEPATPDDAGIALEAAIDRHVAVPDRPDPASLHHRLVEGDRDRFFADKPAWQRAIVLGAGSAMHFTIAIVVLLGGFMLLPQLTGEVTNEIAAVAADSEAEAVGMQPGDRVVAVAGLESDDFLALRDEIRERPGEEIEVVLERDGELTTLRATPTAVEDPETGDTVGQLGFQPALVQRRLGPVEAVEATFVGPMSVPAQAWASIEGVARIFGPEGIGALFGQISGQEDRSAEGGISMVGGAAIAGQGVETAGVMFLLSILASVNVFIGVFNLLPLPPLDGGHLAVLAVERATNAVRGWMGRSTDYKVRMETVAAITVPVLILIGTVGFGLIWLDITNPIQLP